MKSAAGDRNLERLNPAASEEQMDINTCINRSLLKLKEIGVSSGNRQQKCGKLPVRMFFMCFSQ